MKNFENTILGGKSHCPFIKVGQKYVFYVQTALKFLNIIINWGAAQVFEYHYKLGNVLSG